MENIKREYWFAAGGLVIGIVLVLLVQFICRSHSYGYKHMMMGKEMMMRQEMMGGKMGGVMDKGEMMKGNNDMMGMMHSMTMSLEGKTGDEFDKAFLEQMIIHHQGAIDMANLALKNAQHQEIKDLAQKIITAQNSEIEQMKQWQQAWYKK